MWMESWDSPLVAVRWEAATELQGRVKGAGCGIAAGAPQPP